MWRTFDELAFEQLSAVQQVSAERVLRLLDLTAYFNLLDIPQPDGHSAILETLRQDGLVIPSEAGGFEITILGAIVFATDLRDFPRLGGRAGPVFLYRNSERMDVLKDHTCRKGYAAGFETLVDFVCGLLPDKEVLVGALRKTIPLLPRAAVREVLANALIHQDFAVSGARPLVEICNRQLEVSNLGEPLVDTSRLMASPPQARTKALASLMLRCQVGEEPGFGIRNIVQAADSLRPPAPYFEVPSGFTRVILFVYKAVREYSVGELVRACYLHAFLQRRMGRHLAASSLRSRFKEGERGEALAAEIIGAAIERDLIKEAESRGPDGGQRFASFWG